MLSLKYADVGACNCIFIFPDVSIVGFVLGVFWWFGFLFFFFDDSKFSSSDLLTLKKKIQPYEG